MVTSSGRLFFIWNFRQSLYFLHDSHTQKRNRRKVSSSFLIAFIFLSLGKEGKHVVVFVCVFELK